MVIQLFVESPRCPCSRCDKANAEDCDYCHNFTDWLDAMEVAYEASAKERAAVNELLFSN